ncbi:MAG: undecaprenyl diphosphate synthase family protein [Candidatus Lokiarchaeota archaeon]
MLFLLAWKNVWRNKKRSLIIDVDRNMIKEYLYTKGMPEVDYIIRTGMNDGARISGFLLWDSSYAEFRFRKDFWPEYNKEMLYEDLVEYIERNRRKGS